MALTLTKAEFDRFWDEVLTDQWAIDEWVTDRGDDVDDLAPGDVFSIKAISLFWQGVQPPKPTRWITSRQLDNGPNFINLFRKWKQTQTTVTVSFTVPGERVGEVTSAVEALGGQRLV